MKIGLAGANSSVGVNLLEHVARGGDMTVVAGVRSEHAAASLPSAPEIVPSLISYDDVDGMARAFEGVSCLVHLAGILIESRGKTYRSANVDTTAAVVAACRQADVGHILFVSVLGAAVGSPNSYFRSKGEAENVVARSNIPSTILRTPILLGPGTAGADGLVRAASAPKARLLGGGAYTMRPLDLDDLSRAIIRICRAPPDGVVTYELVGPESVPYRDLVERTASLLGRQVTIGATPVWVAKLVAGVTFRLKGGGISPTVIDVITADEVVSSNADADIGIGLTPLSETLEKIVPERS